MEKAKRADKMNNDDNWKSTAAFWFSIAVMVMAISTCEATSEKARYDYLLKSGAKMP